MKKNIQLLLSIGILTCLLADAVHAASKRSKKQRRQEEAQLIEESAALEEGAKPEQKGEEFAIETAEEGAEKEEPGIQGVFSEDDHFDIEAKKNAVITLVEEGIAFFKKHSVSDALNKFTHTSDFVKGELYLFVYDTKGRVLAHGQRKELLWENLYDLKDPYGTYIIRSILEKAEKGGGWITYNWRGATKISYVQEVKKNGQRYIIGSGYYPHSKEDAVVNLVKGATTLFKDITARGEPKELAFSSLSYPIGRFIYGDLYLYALDFKGTMMAQGDRPGLIGTNSWDYQDATGKFTNQEIISKLQETPDTEGIWIEYISKGAQKRAYAEEVIDAKGNHYFIACGYYPAAGRDATVNLVKRGYQFMKGHGKTAAAQEFSDIREQKFLFGDLHLFVYDEKGVCIAHGGNPELIGKNYFNEQDEDGRYYIQELIKKAQAGGGWVDFKLKNSFQSIYVERVELGLENFIIGSGVYPISKQETVLLLAKSGAGFLRTHDDGESFREFIKKDGRFLRGDLGIFVVDTSGICYAWEDTHDLIWKNMMGEKDDTKKPYIKTFINTVRFGAGKVSYNINGRPRIAYVEKIEKGEKTYVIGSAYYK